MMKTDESSLAGGVVTVRGFGAARVTATFHGDALLYASSPRVSQAG